MKKLISFLIICFVFAFLQSCQVFRSKDFYFEVGKVFTETNIKKIFALDTFSFERTKKIDVQKTLPTQKIIKLLGKKLTSKITGAGQARLENQKVTTFVVWTTKDSLTSIRYFRQKNDY